MNESVRVRLKDLVREHGKELCKNAQRVEALLRDYCGEYKQEINILVVPVRFGITEEMMQFQDQTANFRISHWIDRIYREAGIDKNLALWAVESWLIVFGIEHTVPRESVAKTQEVKHHDNADTITVGASTDNAQVDYDAGIVYGKSGDHHRAIDALRRAVFLNPDYADAWFALGVAYYKIGCYGQAKEMFKKATSINPCCGDIQQCQEIANLIAEDEKKERH